MGKETRLHGKGDSFTWQKKMRPVTMRPTGPFFAALKDFKKIFKRKI